MKKLELWLHLVSRHAAIIDPVRVSKRDLIDLHDHEHHGPGTIRNHPADDYSYDIARVAAVLSEANDPHTAVVVDSPPLRLSCGHDALMSPHGIRGEVGVHPITMAACPAGCFAAARPAVAWCRHGCGWVEIPADAQEAVAERIAANREVFDAATR